MTAKGGGERSFNGPPLEFRIGLATFGRAAHGKPAQSEIRDLASEQLGEVSLGADLLRETRHSETVDQNFQFRAFAI